MCVCVWGGGGGGGRGGGKGASVWEGGHWGFERMRKTKVMPWSNTVIFGLANLWSLRFLSKFEDVTLASIM